MEYFSTPFSESYGKSIIYIIQLNCLLQIVHNRHKMLKEKGFFTVKIF
jgi:hypothetical protein